MGAKSAAVADAIVKLHTPESHIGFPDRCVECRKAHPCPTVKIVSKK